MAKSLDDEPSDKAIAKGRDLLNASKDGDSLHPAAARALFEWIESDEIDSSETVLEDVIDNFDDHDDLQDFEWLELFRALDRIELGRVFLGRHGKKTRIEWQGLSSLNVALAVLNRSPNSRTKSRAADATRKFAPLTMRVGGIELRILRPSSAGDFEQMIDVLESLRDKKN